MFAAHHFTDLFVKQLFNRGQVYEQLFQKLCDARCNPDALAGLLFAVCTLAVNDRAGFIEFDDISIAELRRLTRDLLSLANLVERVTKTQLNPKIDLLSAPRDDQRSSARKQFAHLYDVLPGYCAFIQCI